MDENTLTPKLSQLTQQVKNTQLQIDNINTMIAKSGAC
jgi:hypothetical protein